MSKRTKLQKLLSVLTPDQTSVDFSAFDDSVAKLKSALTEKIQAQTVDDVKVQLEKFKKKINLKEVVQAIDDLKSTVDQQIREVSTNLSKEQARLADLLNNTNNQEQVAQVASIVNGLIGQLKALQEQKDGELAETSKRIDDLLADKLNADLNFSKLLDNLTQSTSDNTSEIEKCVEMMEKMRLELTNRINNMPHGGGNANRNITIGGNQSTLSKYTDINLKAGSNVTITYSNNDTTKQLDVTVASSGGGGGSVTGIIRSIETISTSQTAAEVAGTDYVYLCTAGVKLDLPAAAGNTNLYTVKNISNSSVLVSGTIDDDANGIIMPVKYTSVDLISNDTDWKIT